MIIVKTVAQTSGKEQWLIEDKTENCYQELLYFSFL